MTGIVLCGDHYAAVKNGTIVGVVTKSNDTQWEWHPLDGSIGNQYIPIRHALDAAMKFLGAS